MTVGIVSVSCAAAGQPGAHTSGHAGQMIAPSLIPTKSGGYVNAERLSAQSG
jgi:hypothetical protein